MKSFWKLKSPDCDDMSTIEVSVRIQGDLYKMYFQWMATYEPEQLLLMQMSGCDGRVK